MLFFKRSEVLNIFSPIACILATSDGALIPVNVGSKPKPPRSIDLNFSRSVRSANFCGFIFSLNPANATSPSSAKTPILGSSAYILPCSSNGDCIDLPAVLISVSVKSLPGFIAALVPLKALPSNPNKPSPIKPMAASVATSLPTSDSVCLCTPAIVSPSSSTACPVPAPAPAPNAEPSTVPTPGNNTDPKIAPPTPPISSGAMPDKSEKSYRLNPSSSISIFLSVS